MTWSFSTTILFVNCHGIYMQQHSTKTQVASPPALDKFRMSTERLSMTAEQWEHVILWLKLYFSAWAWKDNALCSNTWYFEASPVFPSPQCLKNSDGQHSGDRASRTTSEDLLCVLSHCSRPRHGIASFSGDGDLTFTLVSLTKNQHQQHFIFSWAKDRKRNPFFWIKKQLHIWRNLTERKNSVFTFSEPVASLLLHFGRETNWLVWARESNWCCENLNFLRIMRWKQEELILSWTVSSTCRVKMLLEPSTIDPVSMSPWEDIFLQKKEHFSALFVTLTRNQSWVKLSMGDVCFLSKEPLGIKTFFS